MTTVNISFTQGDIETQITDFVFSDYNIATDIFDGLCKYKILLKDFKTHHNTNLVFKIKINEIEFESVPISFDVNNTQVFNDNVLVSFSYVVEVDETNQNIYKFNKLWIYIKKLI
jgi:hypothetical protein